MISTLDLLQKQTRAELLAFLVDMAANWLAERDPDLRKAHLHKEDIVAGIWSALGTDGSAVFDRHYEAAGALVRAMIYWDASGGRTPTHARGALSRALEHLDPALAAEVARDGAARVYAERWEGRTDENTPVKPAREVCYHCGATDLVVR